ncbi:MAG: ornithine carbamoyltransferase [Myxococcota bacterium]
MTSYLSELDFEPARTLNILASARRLKAERGRDRNDLAGRSVALYFEKPSVRTRVSFTVGIQELGGRVVELSSATTKVGRGEDPEDFAAVLGRMVHLLVARVFSQEVLGTFARRAGVPVINALSDERHPCQALADAQTILERKGRIEGTVFAFVGEGNNVAASTGLLLAALGAEVRVASPVGFGLPKERLAEARGLAGSVTQLQDPKEAVDGADAVYTDTWISMGQEAESEERVRIFRDFKVSPELMAGAREDALVMHCLPAVRGQEIEAELMYADNSAIWDQAENRLHAQKALILDLMTG